ncbi:immunity protein Imm33 domain-containing protein [Komagataeibacter sp. NFXK3]
MWPAPEAGHCLQCQDSLRLINGVRLEPENGTGGWYIWAGEETSDDVDFFVPLHTSHIDNWCALVIPYRGLSPGWRFLIAEGYGDVVDQRAP